MQGASDGGVVVDEGMWLRTAPGCRLPVWAVEEMDHSNKNASCGGSRGTRSAWGIPDVVDSSSGGRAG